MNAILKQLIALQEADTSIGRLNQALADLPAKKEQLHQQFEQQAAEFRTLEAQLAESNSARTRLEIEMAEARTQAERAERNQMGSQNSKDYEAAVRELDMARKRLTQLETSSLEEIEKIETASQQIVEREPEVTRLQADMEQRITELEAGTGTLADSVAEEVTKRELIAAAIPKNVLAAYERLQKRSRKGVAVAVVRNQACSACHVKIRPHMMSAIRRADDMNYCENCGCILYVRPEDYIAAVK